MFALADEALKKGSSVVIDATSSRMVRRVQALRIADRRQGMPVFVECRAAAPILAARLKQRETQPSVSDARLVQLEAFIKRFAPMERIGREIHLRVDTEKPPMVCLRHTACRQPVAELPTERRQLCLSGPWLRQTSLRPSMRR